MFVEFVRSNNPKKLGPFNDVRIVDVALVADSKEIAYYNRDESYWSENWDLSTAIDEIVVQQ